jgi:hypothetical protein
MINRRTKPDGECQSCRGTGYVAGAQPIKTGPYCLNRHPVGYAEARVARLNPECELYRPERARSHQALISATSIGSFVPLVKFVARFQGVAPISHE